MKDKVPPFQEGMLHGQEKFRVVYEEKVFLSRVRSHHFKDSSTGIGVIVNRNSALNRERGDLFSGEGNNLWVR